MIGKGSPINQPKSAYLIFPFRCVNLLTALLRNSFGGSKKTYLKSSCEVAGCTSQPKPAMSHWT